MFRPTALNRRSRLLSTADEELMALVATRDAEAFEVIFDRHGSAAFSLAYRMCGQRSVAEEVVQESFLSLWRYSDRYDEARGSVRAWVLGVVRNQAIDMFRNRSVKQTRDVPDEGIAERFVASEHTELDLIRNEDARQVRDALSGLPAEQREVIELAYFGGFTHTEIAALLQLAAGTVKGRLRLGLTKLRISLGDQAGSVL
jgi:RNA polymerase sigma-70 factor (ECF subfamily)